MKKLTKMITKNTSQEYELFCKTDKKLLTLEEFTSWVMDEMKRSGLGFNRFAAHKDLWPSTLSRVLSGRTKPPPAFCKALGFRAVVIYERIKK